MLFTAKLNLGLIECYWERNAPNESGIKVLSPDERNQCPNIGNISKMMAVSQNQPPHPTFHLRLPAYQACLQGQMEEEQEKIKNCIVLAIISLFNASLPPLASCIPGAGAGEGGEGDKKKPHGHYLNYGLTAGLAGQGRCLTLLSVIAPETKDAAT